MSIQILRGDDGREVYKVVTPSGVVGFIATETPAEVLELFAKKLSRKIRAGERRRAREILAGTDPVVGARTRVLPSPRKS